MKLGPFASWGVKKLLALYVVICAVLSAGVVPLVHTFVLSPEKLSPFTPVSEEVYWVPAQIQIALERLNAEAQAMVAGESDLNHVKVRFAVLSSKLGEMTHASPVRDTLETIPEFDARRQALTDFVHRGTSLLDEGSLDDVHQLLAGIEELRPAAVGLALDARTVEVQARLDRDAEVTKNRHLLFSMFLAMWGAILIIGWLGGSRLVTKERELAANLELLEAKKRALDAAVTAEVARNTFLGKVSHEFNSPLQAMLTNIQLLEPRLQADDRSSTIIRRLMTSLNQLRVQVNDLLDVAEIKSGKLSLRLARVDLATLVHDVVGVHQVAADVKHLTLRVEAQQMPVVYTDGRRISQIITNLVTNAIRHTETGGVTVTARLKEGRAGSPSVLLSIDDTGMGFAPEVRENLFQPFVQAKRYRGGTGLGLAIVKGLVDQFNGNIQLESLVGVGSTFTVEIPVSLQPVGTDAEDEDYRPLQVSATPTEVAVVNGVDVAQSRRPMVLIVEDNADLLDTLSEYLTDKGYSVHTASSLESSEAMLNTRRYAAIITDMELGDGLGTDVAQAAKKGVNADVPIICCTAYPKLLSDDAARIFDVKLAKPVEPQAIVDAIARMASISA